MPRKKLVNLIIAAGVIIFSSLAIFFLNDSSKLSSPFDTKTPEMSSADVYEEEVFGQSAIVSEEPETSDSEEARGEENSDNQEVGEEENGGYEVVEVVDGDTLDVETPGKIERLRLIGIDTPETVDPRKEVQCFGKEASNKAKELLSGQFVTLESDESQGERDKYKRLLRYVFLPDGTNFNLYMIAEGYAHEYTYDEPYKYQPEFKQAEIDARNNNKGLWSPDTCSGKQ